MDSKKMAGRTLALAAAFALALVLAPATALAEEGDGGEAPSYTLVPIEGTGNATWHQEETVECWPDELGATKDGFDEEVAVDQDGYHGKVPLVEVKEEPVYASATYEVNRQATFSGLPTNDVANIPQTQGFTSDYGNWATLTLAA